MEGIMSWEEKTGRKIGKALAKGCSLALLEMAFLIGLIVGILVIFFI